MMFYFRVSLAEQRGESLLGRFWLGPLSLIRVAMIHDGWRDKGTPELLRPLGPLFPLVLPHSMLRL